MWHNEFKSNVTIPPHINKYSIFLLDYLSKLGKLIKIIFYNSLLYLIDFDDDHAHIPLLTIF